MGGLVPAAGDQGRGPCGEALGGGPGRSVASGGRGDWSGRGVDYGVSPMIHGSYSAGLTYKPYVRVFIYLFSLKTKCVKCTGVFCVKLMLLVSVVAALVVVLLLLGFFRGGAGMGGRNANYNSTSSIIFSFL